jgi:hypothetical protein
MDAELAFLIAKHRQSGNTATLNFLLRYESLASSHADLLAALEAVLPHAVEVLPHDLHMQARAAIAKAKGLSPQEQQK